MYDNYLDEQDLVENPSTRVPICLCIDVSRSMSYHNGVDLLKKGIAQFYQSLMSDDTTRLSAEVAIVTFASDVKVVEDFSLVEKKRVPELETGGNTLLGTGVLDALQLLEKRKEKYKQNGVDYYQPWLIIMTDGGSHGESAAILKEAQKKARELEYAKKLTVMAIGVGQKADMKELNAFSNKFEAAFSIQSVKFNDLFEFLSKSVSAVASNSFSEEKMEIEIATIKHWGEI